MTDYSRLATEPEQFLAPTGSTLEEFAALLPIFSDCFLAQMQELTLAGTPRQKLYVSYQNCPLPTLADKLLFILRYLRKATTQDIFGAVFDMAQPVANQWIHRLHPCLNQALATLKNRPSQRASTAAKRSATPSRTTCWLMRTAQSSCSPHLRGQKARQEGG
jgi:hypothetical protein